jgi:hypothetical protein
VIMANKKAAAPFGAAASTNKLDCSNLPPCQVSQGYWSSSLVCRPCPWSLDELHVCICTTYVASAGVPIRHVGIVKPSNGIHEDIPVTIGHNASTLLLLREQWGICSLINKGILRFDKHYRAARYRRSFQCLYNSVESLYLLVWRSALITTTSETPVHTVGGKWYTCVKI